MRKLLAVMPEHTRYNPSYIVTVARSFTQAQALLQKAEQEGEPFDELDLPVSNEKNFWCFLHWLRSTGRNYPFSIFGCKDDKHFWDLCNKIRKYGFHLNT